MAAINAAVLTSKAHKPNVGRMAIAAIGILLLSPVSGTGLDTFGVLFALLAGVAITSFASVLAHLVIA